MMSRKLVGFERQGVPYGRDALRERTGTFVCLLSSLDGSFTVTIGKRVFLSVAVQASPSVFLTLADQMRRHKIGRLIII